MTAIKTISVTEIFAWIFLIPLLKGMSMKGCLYYCVESVRIRSDSGPYYPAFGLNREKCGVSLFIQSECGKMQTRITLNTGTFHAVYIFIVH